MSLIDETLLVRYGAIPQVSRFRSRTDIGPARGTRAVVRTNRGLEIGTVLEQNVSVGSQTTHDDSLNPDSDVDDLWRVLRIASDVDETTLSELRRECESEFAAWRRRIEDWNLDLELIDLERTLDRSRLILYVLNERGPDCTKLALQAAAAGLGLIDVQPVDATGLVQLDLASGGCGSGGCGCGH